MAKDMRDQDAVRRIENYPIQYRLSIQFQEKMRSLGIAWHNTFSDECTHDFGCCTNIGDYKERIPATNKPVSK
jgi:hypothetical protein